MSDEVIINDKKYLAIRLAADAVLYSPDYITRLAREQKVKAVRLGRRWFVHLDSLKAYTEVQQQEQGIRKKLLRDQRIVEREQKQRPVKFVAAVRPQTEIQNVAVAVGLLIAGTFVGLELSQSLPERTQVAAVAKPSHTTSEIATETMLRAAFVPQGEQVTITPDRSVARPTDESAWVTINYE